MFIYRDKINPKDIFFNLSETRIKYHNNNRKIKEIVQFHFLFL